MPEREAIEIRLSGGKGTSEVEVRVKNVNDLLLGRAFTPRRATIAALFMAPIVLLHSIDSSGFRGMGTLRRGRLV